MAEYGLNVNIGLRFSTQAKRTATINKLKELKALLNEDEIVKVNVKKFDTSPVTTYEDGTSEDVDLDA